MNLLLVMSVATMSKLSPGCDAGAPAVAPTSMLPSLVNTSPEMEKKLALRVALSTPCRSKPSPDVKPACITSLNPVWLMTTPGPSVSTTSPASVASSEDSISRCVPVVAAPKLMTALSNVCVPEKAS